MFAKTFIIATALLAVANALPTSNTPSARALCSTPTSDELSNVVCPAVITTEAFLQFQADNLNTQADSILGSVVDLIDETTNNKDTTNILSSATEGLTGSILIGVTNFLYGAANVADGLDPQCRCNAQACYSDLRNAAGDGAAGTTNTQAACAEAKYYCAPFYTSDQVNQMIPACAKYSGATNAD